MQESEKRTKQRIEDEKKELREVEQQVSQFIRSFLKLPIIIHKPH